MPPVTAKMGCRVLAHPHIGGAQIAWPFTRACVSYLTASKGRHCEDPWPVPRERWQGTNGKHAYVTQTPANLWGTLLTLSRDALRAAASLLSRMRAQAAVCHTVHTHFADAHQLHRGSRPIAVVRFHRPRRQPMKRQRLGRVESRDSHQISARAKPGRAVQFGIDLTRIRWQRNRSADVPARRI